MLTCQPQKTCVSAWIHDLQIHKAQFCTRTRRRQARAFWGYVQEESQTTKDADAKDKAGQNNKVISKQGVRGDESLSSAALHILRCECLKPSNVAEETIQRTHAQMGETRR